MINFKNILKVLLVALFVCVWNEEVLAQSNGGNSFVIPINDNTRETLRNTYGQDYDSKAPEGASYHVLKNVSILPDSPETKTEIVVGDKNGANDASFCSADYGIFSELVKTGQMIFNRLRDLIYVVAGFGIIAVAVGGFFGNLNWKWLGAIVISLVVIATAGELIVLITGCETFGSSLITNTLTYPTGMSTAEYNDTYTVEREAQNPRIDWDDSMDKEYVPYRRGSAAAPEAVEQEG